MAMKSSSAKVIGGILGRFLVVTKWTNWISRRCILRVKLEHPLPSKPPTIVFTCSVVYMGPRFSREGLLRIRPSLWPTFSSGSGPTIVLMTSRTPCLDRSFLRGLLLCGRVLHIGSHSFSSWSDVGHRQNDVILLAHAVRTIFFDPLEDIFPSRGINMSWRLSGQTWANDQLGYVPLFYPSTLDTSRSHDQSCDGIDSA